jgi:hypothetical protein
MPSAALLKFESNMLVDVDRMIKSHSDLNHEGMGRRGLGHITRGGVLMLCAAWELYIEELAVESAAVFVVRSNSPGQLPLPVRKEISKVVRESKHELKPLELAGDGWATIYRNHVGVCVNGLNTPKSANLDPLFKRLIGIEELSVAWSLGKTEVNGFVTARGDIAHRGRNAGYVTINRLHEYRALVVQTVVDTDNFLADYLQQETPENRSPWRRRVT